MRLAVDTAQGFFRVAAGATGYMLKQTPPAELLAASGSGCFTPNLEAELARLYEIEAALIELSV